VLTYLPFIFKLILFPFFITEWLLTTLVTTVVRFDARRASFRRPLTSPPRFQ